MAKKIEKAKTAELVEVESPELVAALQDGSHVQAFIANLRVFFAQAQQLDMSAQATLARMESMRLPTNAAEDELVMNEVRAINLQKKTVDEHWAVTQLLSRMHKWTVARRERAGKALDQAALIGNNLHGTFKQAEIRRAQQEQLRLQQQAEADARAAQERQAAELEKAALKVESMSPDLSDREQLFVQDYLLSHNGPAAARRTGYKDPDAAALRLLKTPKIIKALEAGEKAIALRQQATAIKEAPVEVETVMVRADVAQGGDSTRWSAEILDPRKFVDAVCEGTHGIPRDTVGPLQTVLNDYARKMQHLIDRWPGVRSKKTTSIR